MPSKKPWLRLADIAENVRKVLIYTNGMDSAAFIGDELTSDATERCLMRISEAAIKLGSFADELLPTHDWQAIRGVGNILRHDYDKVSVSMIWGIVQLNLTPLLNDLEAALAAHESTEI